MPRTYWIGAYRAVKWMLLMARAEARDEQCREQYALRQFPGVPGLPLRYQLSGEPNQFWIASK